MDGLELSGFGDHVLRTARIALEMQDPEYARMHRRYFRDELAKQRSDPNHNPKCQGCAELVRVLVELEALVPPERDRYP